MTEASLPFANLSFSIEKVTIRAHGPVRARFLLRLPEVLAVWCVVVETEHGLTVRAEAVGKGPGRWYNVATLSPTFAQRVLNAARPQIEAL